VKALEDRLKKQLDFILEADKSKLVGRQSYIADGSRKENDAEHSWHMALMTILLSEYANEQMDVLKVISMLLVHDIVEIDAGDTYAYDTDGNATKRERELAAADRIFNLLPADQAEKMRSLWDEFEAYETIEARFAHTMDNMQPLMLNDATGGKAWREHQVHDSQVYGRNKRSHEGSEALWQYMDSLIKRNMEMGNIIKD
jgi:putative hydrolase of HD superfamily